MALSLSASNCLRVSRHPTPVKFQVMRVVIKVSQQNQIRILVKVELARIMALEMIILARTLLETMAMVVARTPEIIPERTLEIIPERTLERTQEKITGMELAKTQKIILQTTM
jgi:hypothetical protein